MLTSLMYELGEHASVAHVHTRTHVASMLLLALRGKTEHLRPIRPPLGYRINPSPPPPRSEHRLTEDGWMGVRMDGWTQKESFDCAFIVKLRKVV